MNNNQYNPDDEFASRISEAMTFYGLEEGDIGKLIGTNATDIRNIVNLEKTLGLKRANKIASVFGMKYYQFGNPKTKFLAKDRLPKRTISAINERIKSGPSTGKIDTELNLPMHTMEVLSKFELLSEFTPKSIHEKLPEDIKSKVESNRITVLFKTGSLRNFVQYADKKDGTNHVYRFISAEAKKTMEEVLKKLKEKEDNSKD